jgi:P27 family predicted phage terminase small subunit
VLLFAFFAYYCSIEKQNNMSENTDTTVVFTPPEYLNERAKEIFQKTCKLIAQDNKLKEVDLDLIAMYAVELELYEDCCKKLSDKKYLNKAPSGYAMINPLVNLRNGALKHAQDLGKLFGISVYHRAKLHGNPKEQAKTKVSKLKILQDKSKVS